MHSYAMQVEFAIVDTLRREAPAIDEQDLTVRHYYSVCADFVRACDCSGRGPRGAGVGAHACRQVVPPASRDRDKGVTANRQKCGLVEPIRQLSPDRPRLAVTA